MTNLSMPLTGFRHAHACLPSDITTPFSSVRRRNVYANGFVLALSVEQWKKVKSRWPKVMKS